MQSLFGVNLRKVALIVGTLYVLVFVYATIHSSINLANSYRVNNEEEKLNSQWGINTSNECFHIFFVSLSAISLVCSLFLIMGSLRHNPCYLLIWLIDGGIILVMLSLCLIYSFYLLVISILYDKYLHPGTAAAVFTALLLILGLKIYIWFGIQQLYKDIRQSIYRRRSLPSSVPLYTQVDEIPKYVL